MVLRIVLGGLFVAMAAGQLVSFAQMPGILAAYGLVSGVGATALAVALIAGELVCGVWFLARPRSRARVPVWVFTGVAVVWALLAAQAYARGLLRPLPAPAAELVRARPGRTSAALRRSATARQRRSARAVLAPGTGCATRRRTRDDRAA